MQEGGLTDVISALHLSRKYEWEQLIKKRIKANWEGKGKHIEMWQKVERER